VCQDNNNTSHLHSEDGFRHSGNNMAVLTDDASTIEEIDEALGFLYETLRSRADHESFMAIIDELLEARFGMAQ
jgi:hypothetical protein